jgi:hypothetical protein
MTTHLENNDLFDNKEIKQEDYRIALKFALILDEKIIDIIHAEERLASLLLKNTEIVDVTEKIEELESLGLSLIDATYDSETEEFTLATQY